MTLIEIILLMFGGLPLFDSMLLSFGSAGTGGFSILNSGFADYSPYIQYTVTVFMILFGINFNVYYFILIRKFKDAWKFEELKYYLFVIAAAVLCITYNIRELLNPGICIPPCLLSGRFHYYDYRIFLRGL